MQRVLLSWVCLCLLTLPVLSFAQSCELEENWNSLLRQGGCLTGGQYIRHDRFGGEGCVMGAFINKNTYRPARMPRIKGSGWAAIFQCPKSELGPFLLAAMESDDSTQIHTCPFFTATEGEVAVYVLQAINWINWMELPGFSQYQDREITGAQDNHQAWLQAILRDPVQRNRMRQEWEKIMLD